MTNFILTPDLTLEEAEIIAQGIESESNHMIPKTPEEILSEFHACGGLSAKVSGQVAGIIKLSVLNEEKELFERGSLFVLPEYRKHGIGTTLIYEINKKFQDLALLSVTNVPAVKNINNADENQFLVPREELGSLLPIIEWPQALLPEDEVFLNKTLYARLKNGEF